ELEVMAQPVDPVILRDLGIDGDPVQNSHDNGSRVNQLK
ncbi:hypothetical protein AK812_SmicGene47909, partial [Symbiodinium microadriaticum]